MRAARRRGATTTRPASDRHPDLADALGWFAARPDSLVIVVMSPSERDPGVMEVLERRGVAVCHGVDLACETGAGTGLFWCAPGRSDAMRTPLSMTRPPTTAPG